MNGALSVHCIILSFLVYGSLKADLEVELSLGDFVDKMIILEIKSKRFADPVKLKNVNTELGMLRSIFDKNVQRPAEFEQLYERLLLVNEHLWELEDLTRTKERTKEFDEHFAGYVKDIINSNDERARIKHEMNIMLGSQIIEEKSYVDLLQGLQTKTKSLSRGDVTLAIPVPLADIADRITILEIKADRIKDDEKIVNIKQELGLLRNKFYNAVPSSTALEQLMYELRIANEEMWDIQDGLRAKRRASQYDDEFIRLGRSVYYANDKRMGVKRSINQLLGSRLVEEKSYAAY